MPASGKPSKELMALADDVITHISEHLAAQPGPIVPYLYLERNGEIEAEAVVVGAGDEVDIALSVSKAKEDARRQHGKADRVAVGYDGRIRLQDDRTRDCIFVEVFEEGSPHTFVIGQAYQPADHAEGFSLINDPFIGDRSPPMW